MSWREHVIDDRTEDGQPLTGGDGLVLADLDSDGREDIVSVHESDTQYDGRPDGHVRIAFATARPDRWVNVTLGRGEEAAAPEDAAIGDLNGDGHPDVVVASELAHLVYFQNPGRNARQSPWPRLVVPATLNRGSYIRVFIADLDGDGRPEVATANKGAQNPDPQTTTLTPISIFRIDGDPLLGASWREQELGRYRIPQNTQTIDIDSDGDQDVIGGVRVGARLILFLNDGKGLFREIPLQMEGARTGGFNLAYADFNGDGRLDIVGATGAGLGWFEQPPAPDGAWRFHLIGDFGPDSLTGLVAADLDGDGDQDVMSGSYSRGPRDHDVVLPLDAPMGRLGWFENPGSGGGEWIRHDISRRQRGMFDSFAARDLDGDGDLDLLGTRGNSAPYDGVYWLEQVRSEAPRPTFQRARREDGAEIPLPPGK